jgi:uncharacterized protein (DUF4213/DUF364 family)
MIIEKTYDLIRSRYGDRFYDVVIKHVVAGIYFTAVELSSGYCGLASSDLNSLDCSSHNRSRGYGEFTPGNFSGLKVAGLFNLSESSCSVKTLQLAVMNALSAELTVEPAYKVTENLDPFDLLDLTMGKRVCLVGAFLSYMQKIATANCALQIVELNEAAVPDEYKTYLVPSALAAKAISESEIVIITGASLANNTLDKLLEMIPLKTQVVLVGPTSSLLPDVLFAHGVDIMGAIRITDASKMLQLVAEGAAGFHLYHYCATKICIRNES